MKNLLFFAGLALLPALPAAVIVNLDQATLTGAPGDAVTFFGTIQNTGGQEQFLTTVNLNTSPELTATRRRSS